MPLERKCSGGILMSVTFRRELLDTLTDITGLFKFPKNGVPAISWRSGFGISCNFSIRRFIRTHAG